MQRFGEKLRTLRQRQGLRQRELGDLLGVSEGHIGLMENGRKIPSVPVLVKISRLFDVSLDQLAKDEFELDG